MLQYMVLKSKTISRYQKLNSYIRKLNNFNNLPQYISIQIFKFRTEIYEKLLNICKVLHNKRVV